MQGGRLVSERKMVSDIYMFDLESFRWEKIAQSSEDDIPQARYFHSADTCMSSFTAGSAGVLPPNLTSHAYPQGGTTSSFLVVWRLSPSPTTRRTCAS